MAHRLVQFSLWRSTLAFLLAALPGLALAQKAAEEELPERVEEKIEVKDGLSKLTMFCDYYPSTLGKQAIPVLLLHGRGGTRADYAHLALYLQQQGHAVLVPDLRGHGDSNEIVLANGKREKLDPAKMKKAEFAAIVRDLEEVKAWFVQKNNAEELNVEMLTVVGADLMAITAMNFALRDWTVPELLSYKNCKDVKAIVLLSPDQSKEGTDMRLALKHDAVGYALSILIVVGKNDSGALSEAKKLYNLLETQHKEKSADKRPEDKEIVFLTEDTKLQGTKLVDERMKAPAVIGQFIQFRVRAFEDTLEWTKRIKPGDEK
jgi:pimeloyl-ACP methyl ester carboxylesterase